MDDKDFIQAEFEASARLLEGLAGSLSEPIARASRLISERIKASGKLLVFGNGGSAADAQHFSAELVGRYRRERPAIPAVSLATDTSLLTAVGNDYSFDEIFSRQVSALARPGDVVVGISTSGRSPNVLAGLRAARQRGAHTIALIGAEKGEVASAAELILSVPSQDTARVQEAHAVIIHIISDLVEQALMPPTEGQP